MTATDELRRLLDERGVEHGRHCSGLPTETTYKHGGIDWMAVERTDGMLHLYCRTYLTPEQAVEAALGRGTCRFEWALARNGWADHTCSACGYRENTDIHVSLGWNYCPNCGRKVVDA